MPRIDAVFIRKSTQGQDEEAQKQNVVSMLAARSVAVSPERWFTGTVSRRKVKANADFNRLMALVEADQVGTVYVESQDRWGTGDRVELYSLLGTLRQHGTRLFDLRAGKDLTEKDLATEMMAFIGSIKSQKELEDTAYRSLRTRVNNFRDTGTWPTGTHPYGFGKRCYSADGKLLWEWQPVDRRLGQVFFAGADGTLKPGPDNVKIPAKEKGARQKTVLVPGKPKYAEAVRLIFDLYTRVGLSRRQIAKRLNEAGYKFNGGTFGHQDVSNILGNPAYVGDTHFGKVQTGELQTFDATGIVSEVKTKRKDKRRSEDECLVKTDTHEGLIDRKTWELAQKKFADEQKRTSHAPRNDAYYLKQLFVCGHCGKSMRGRTETDPKTGRKIVIYVCSSYVDGSCNGTKSECGYQRITHADAERLLLDKIKQMGLDYDPMASTPVRKSLEKRLKQLEENDEQLSEQWQKAFRDGTDAFADYLNESLPELDWHQFKKLRKQAAEYYCGEGDDLAELKLEIIKAEGLIVEKAKAKLAELRKEHSLYTKNWFKATDMMQDVVRPDMQKVERAIADCELRIRPLSQRLEMIYADEEQTRQERQHLLAEYPKLEAREKGEAMRRLFKSVTLFWDKKFHAASERPTRKRTTSRPGRWSYTLKTSEISWDLAVPDMASFR